MHVMHNRVISEKYFSFGKYRKDEHFCFMIWQEPRLWLKLSESRAQNSKNSGVAIWRLSDKNQVGILFRKELNA